MRKKYSLLYDKDLGSLKNGLNKGDVTYFTNYYNDYKSGSIYIGDFDDEKDLENLFDICMDLCQSNGLSMSRKRFDEFKNSMDACDTGYFYIKNTDEKVYLSTIENEYNIHIDENNNELKEYKVNDLTLLFRRDRYDNLYAPAGYDFGMSTKDINDIKKLKRLTLLRRYTTELDKVGWFFCITLEEDNKVYCAIYNPNNQVVHFDSYLDIKKAQSASQYYCQEGFIREINQLIKTGVIVKR